MRMPHRQVLAVVSTVGLLGLSTVASAVPSLFASKPATQRAPMAAVAADPVQTLRQDLDAILSQPGIAAEHASVLVRTATGDTLYDRAPADRLVPASNAKLFSSTAALEVLGLDHRFPTTALADGIRSSAELRGDLYLRGQGDPTMLASDYDDLAAKVAASGVTTVRGKLIADDTWYDSTRLGNSWAWDDEPFYYSGQVSALTVSPNTDYDAGTVIVESRPGAKAGDPAKLTLVPDTGYVKLVNHATTSASGANTISVERRHGNNTIDITGSIPLGHAVDQEWSTVWEPTGYAADVFRRALSRHGVHVTGPTAFAAAPSGADVLATHESMTLGQLLVPFLKLSNNGHAEVLVKEMGREASGQGSWSAGLAAETSALRALGVDTSTVRLVDGSGLSRQDFVTPQQITNLLIGARSQPWFETWYSALPIAGVSDRFTGGTLRSRMVGTPAAGNVHGKTGSLTAVSALSGYVNSADGEPLVFSVVQNFYLGVDAKKIEDQVAIRLAQFSRTATTDLRQPTTPHIPSVPRTDYGPAGLECSWVKGGC